MPLVSPALPSALPLMLVLFTFSAVTRWLPAAAHERGSKLGRVCGKTALSRRQQQQRAAAAAAAVAAAVVAAAAGAAGAQDAAGHVPACRVSYERRWVAALLFGSKISLGLWLQCAKHH